MLEHNALNYFLHAWREGIPQHNRLHRMPVQMVKCPFRVRDTAREGPQWACLRFTRSCSSGGVGALWLHTVPVAENELGEQSKHPPWVFSSLQWSCLGVYFEYILENSIKMRKSFLMYVYLNHKSEDTPELVLCNSRRIMMALVGFSLSLCACSCANFGLNFVL